jgi:hypothetical protein
MGSRGVKGGLSVEVDGMMETLAAVKGVEASLRPAINGELRDAAETSAGELAVELVSAASTSGVPVAPLVARSIRVKRDRIPVVSIGGAMRVGTGGDRAPAGRLVWGSEQGPKGEINHWAVPPSSGYWIAPAVERYSRHALANFQRAVLEIFKRYGLA